MERSELVARLRRMVWEIGEIPLGFPDQMIEAEKGEIFPRHMDASGSR